MAAVATITWIERLVWVAIYGGMFSIVLGLAVSQVHGVAAAALWTIGALAVAAGVVLIWVRSRLQPDNEDKEP